MSWAEPHHDYINEHNLNCETKIEKDGSGTFHCMGLYDHARTPKVADVINGKFKISFGDAPPDEK